MEKAYYYVFAIKGELLHNRAILCSSVGSLAPLDNLDLIMTIMEVDGDIFEPESVLCSQEITEDDIRLTSEKNLRELFGFNIIHESVPQSEERKTGLVIMYETLNLIRSASS